MKNLKVMLVALVAMLCFSACEQHDGDFIEYDYSKNLVGTWTCMDNDYAEAMVINADGSFAITGITAGGSLHEDKGILTVVNNKISLKFESSGETLEGRLEIVAGETMSIVLNDKFDIRATYHYCKEDLSDKVIGTWVCNDGPEDKENDMLIQTFKEDGKVIFTGVKPNEDGYSMNQELSCKIVGDLMFAMVPNVTPVVYTVTRLVYSPNGTSLGDILTQITYAPLEEGFVYKTSSWLRVKQGLNLAGQKYAYSSAYVSNAKGTDEEFTILSNTFNMANIEGGDFDVLFRSELFCVDLNANSIKQYFRSNGRDIEIDIPITVDGNKVTLDLSAENAAYRKVDIYMYQDADDSQLHMYMHTKAFIDYFANMELYNLLAEGKINADDTAAVEKVFADMEARIESINVSFVFKARN